VIGPDAVDVRSRQERTHGGGDAVKDAVDLKDRRVHVRRNYHRGRLGTPKSGLSREVPLSETATRALAAASQVTS
jgi:hypothetical protein